MLKNFLELPYHSQEQESTCTAACVRMVLDSFGQSLPERDIADLLGTDPRGTPFLALMRLEGIGIDVTIRPGTLTDLRSVNQRRVPVIVAVHTAHLPTHPLPPWTSHCVVVAGATRSEVAIYDPDPQLGAHPNLVPVARFEAAWRAREFRMALLTLRQD